MQHDAGRVDTGDLGDGGEKPVPERERVAGMEAAVGELVDPVQREVPERVELAHAGEMEQAVAADLAGDVPEENAEDGTGKRRPAASPAARSGTRRRR